MQITPFYSGRMAYDVTADDGSKYVFVPEEFVNKGFIQDGVQYYEPEFLKAGAFDNAASITLPTTEGLSDQAKSLYKTPNKGFIWKAEDFSPLNSDDFTIQNYVISDRFPAIEGLSTFNGATVYKVPTESGWQASYITGLNNKGNTNFRSTRMEGGSSWLGGVLGGWVDDFTTSTGISDIAGSINDFFQTDLGKAIKFASLASSLSNLATEGASSEVGGVTGPDNIDVGGGFNPAAAAPVVPTAETITNTIAQSPAAEQVAAEQAAVQQAIAEQSAPITAETITSQISTPAAEQIAAEQAAAQMSAEQFAAEQAAAQAAQEEAARIAAENAAYDQAMQDLANNYVSPQFATAAAAQGMNFKQGLDAVRAGLLINALTGDPLGLSDVGAGGGPSFAQTGFQQVAVPTEWKSPEYTYTPVQNVTFEDLFPGVSLQGTQWQNMPQAQTFNQLFAVGRQTPMGTPVDLNQIVGSILGQSTTG